MVVNLFNNQFTASLWGDEAFSAVLSQKSPLEIIQVLMKDTSPPLYNLISHFWLLIFGPSETAIRALSFLFYLGTIITVYFLADFLWKRKTAVIAALLTALNPFLFVYAFEGRMYSLLYFTTTLSFYFFIRRQWFFYIAAVTAALYSHHFSIFAILLQASWILIEIIKKPVKNWRLFWPFLIILILYLPWMYSLYYQTSLVKSGFWLSRPDLNSVFNLFKDYLAQNQKDKIKNIILALTLLILIFRRWSLKKQKNDILLSLWFLFPLIMTFIISRFMISIFYNRYLLYIIPGLLLLMASQRRQITLVFLSALLVIWLIADFNYFFNPTKKPFREFTLLVKNNISSRELLINYNGKAHHLWESKFYGLTAPIYSPSGSLPFFVGTAQMKAEDILSNLNEQEEVAVISSDNPQEINIENFQIKDYKNLDGLYLIKMKRVKNSYY